MWKNINLILLFLVAIPSIHSKIIAQGNDSLFVSSWNVENLFDTLDDVDKDDEEFHPGGPKDWSYQRMERKVMNIAKVMKYMNDGRAPDVIGLQEVENIMVCKYIAYEFDTRDYIVCHRQSPDRRGIDNALLYDRNVLDVVSVEAINVALPTGNPTRDILYVSLKYKATGDTLHFFVNHFPSRRGGMEKSEPNRLAAAKTLRNKIDSLQSVNSNAEILIMGDFNDEPSNKSIKEILQGYPEKYFTGDNELLNLANDSYNNGEGTYLYRSDWNMLDQMIISKSLMDKRGADYVDDSFVIVKPDFIIQKEGKYAGSPKPTFGGKKYLGGYSDHFPVACRLHFCN